MSDADNDYMRRAAEEFVAAGRADTPSERKAHRERATRMIDALETRRRRPSRGLEAR